MTKTSVQELSRSEYMSYDEIPCSFTVQRILRVEPVNGGTGGLSLVEESVENPYIKDFALGGNDGPTSWSEEFDTSDWGIFVAKSDGEVVGGTTIVTNTDLYPLNRFQRGDLAVMWDMRVHPNWRQAGVAGELFRYASQWASKRGFSQLGMETQNTNVPVFRFLMKQGCRLGAIHRYGYAGQPDVSHESMFLWYYDLGSTDESE